MWRNKKGISPIVGVILVVAMTVLLAAIAWTYLGGFTKTSPKTYQVAVKVRETLVENGKHRIVITYLGGPDQDKVVQLEFIGTNSSNKPMKFKVEGSNMDIKEDLKIKVDTVVNGKYVLKYFNGTSWVNVSDNTFETDYIPLGVTVYSDNGTAGKDHIIVNALFSDGTEQTLYDDYI